MYYSLKLFSYYIRPERTKRKLCKLKLLFAERNADNRYAEQQAPQKMLQSERYARKDHPEKIEDRRPCPAGVNDLFSKRKKT